MSGGRIIDRLYASLGWKYDPSGVKAASKDLDGVKAKTSSWGQTAARVGKAAAAGFAVAATAAATAATAAARFAASAVQEYAEVGDRIAKTAKQIGISGESFQRLSFAAGRSGAKTEDLTIGLRTLNKQLVMAEKTGTGPLVDALKGLGLGLEDLAGKSAEEQIGLLADRLNGVEDPARRAATASLIFGDAGAKLAPMLAEGSRGLRDLYAIAERQPNFLDAEQLENAESLTDALSDLKAQAQGVTLQIGAALAPAVKEIAADVGEWVRENQQFLRQDVPRYLGAVIEGMRGGARVLADAVDQWRYLVIEAGRWASWVEDVLPGTGEVFASVFEALADPIGSLMTVLDAVAARIDQVAAGLGAIEDASKGLRSWLGSDDTPRTSVRGGVGFLGETQAEGDARMAKRSPSELIAITMNPNASQEDKDRAMRAMRASTKRQGEVVQLTRGLVDAGARGAGLLGGLLGVEDKVAAAGKSKGVRARGRGGGGGGSRSGGGPADLAGAEPSIDDLINGVGGDMGEVLAKASRYAPAGGGDNPLAGAQIVRVDASFHGGPITLQFEIPEGVAVRGEAREFGETVRAEIEPAIHRIFREVFDHYSRTVAL